MELPEAAVANAMLGRSVLPPSKSLSPELSILGSASAPFGCCAIDLHSKCQAQLLLTNSQLPLGKESVHAVNVSHQFRVPKGEINHVSLGGSSCQDLY